MSERNALGGVVAAAFVFCCLYIGLDLNKLHALRYGVDVGIFLQTMVNFAHSGTTFNWAEGRQHLFVHDSWVLLAFAPLVAAIPRPETLIVIECVAVAASAIPLYFLSREFDLEPSAALFVGLAYLISPSVQGLAYGSFIENIFVPLFGFSLALAARRRSLLWTLLFAQLLMGTKEDQIWFIAWFGLIGAIWYDRRLGISVFGLALINGAAYYGILHALGQAPNAPRYGLVDHEIPQQLAFFAEVLAPFAFAPLWLGVRILVALPLVAEITLNGPWTGPLARAGTHYAAPIVTLIAIGAVAAMTTRPGLARYAVGLSCVMALFFNVTVLHIGRYLYEPNDAGFTHARVVAESGAPYTFTMADEGQYAIAAGNVNVRFDRRGSLPARPAFNTTHPWWP